MKKGEERKEEAGIKRNNEEKETREKGDEREEREKNNPEIRKIATRMKSRIMGKGCKQDQWKWKKDKEGGYEEEETR